MRCCIQLEPVAHVIDLSDGNGACSCQAYAFTIRPRKSGAQIRCKHAEAAREYLKELLLEEYLKQYRERRNEA